VLYLQAMQKGYIWMKRTETGEVNRQKNRKVKRMMRLYCYFV